jgi:hypothetical protein
VALEQAKRVKIVQEDRVQLEIDGKLLRGENASVKIVDPKTTDKTIYAGYTDAGESKSANFRVRVNQGEKVEAKVKLLSTRGGYLERTITIGQ